MRPALAIVPLALLLAWFGPSPSGDAGPSSAFGLSQGPVHQHPASGATDPLAPLRETIRWGGLLQATSEVPQRR